MIKRFQKNYDVFEIYHMNNNLFFHDKVAHLQNLSGNIFSRGLSLCAPKSILNIDAFSFPTVFWRKLGKVPSLERPPWISSVMTALEIKPVKVARYASGLLRFVKKRALYFFRIGLRLKWALFQFAYNGEFILKFLLCCLMKKADVDNRWLFLKLSFELKKNETSSLIHIFNDKNFFWGIKLF